MPTFDFICKKCGKTEEVFQKHDDPPPICEEHGDMTKQVTAPAIRKGGGLYSMDVQSAPEKFGDFK